MHYPENLFYTKDHEWIRFEGDQAFIGITDFAQHELGDIVYVDITTLEKTLEKEAIFGTVEAVKTVSDLFMPVGGHIIEVNFHLDKHPELINADPYSCWMIRIALSSPDEQQGLLNAAEYKHLIGE